MRTAISIACSMVLIAGCGYERGSGAGYPDGSIASITLEVSSTDLMASAGDTRVATAVAKDAYQTVIPAPSLTWRTNAPTVATVEGSGASATITAVDDGTAIISAASGNALGTITVTVRRKLVSIELSGPLAIVTAGLTTQVTTVGRDARQQPIVGLTDVTYTTSNAFSVRVSASGLVSALFSTVQPSGAVITATVVRDGVTLSATKRIDVGSAAPPIFDLSSLLTTDGVRPEPLFGLAQAGVFFTLDGTRVNYTIAWSLLSGPPLGAHIHGPESNDAGIADVLVDLPLGTGASINGLFTGSFSAPDIHPQGGKPAITLDSLVALMRTFSAYIDMHTAANPDGEVRGLPFRHLESESSGVVR